MQFFTDRVKESVMKTVNMKLQKNDKKYYLQKRQLFFEVEEKHDSERYVNMHQNTPKLDAKQTLCIIDLKKHSNISVINRCTSTASLKPITSHLIFILESIRAQKKEMLVIK